MRSALFSLITFFAFQGPAHAHWGHVGEVAGHGHIIAVGALIGAAILAAALLGTKEEESEEEVEEDAEAEGETA